jgi:hypothetical protein
MWIEMLHERESWGSLERAFQTMVVLLGIFQATLFQYLITIIDIQTERATATKFMASLTIPLLICIGVWFYKSFVFTKKWKIVCCLFAYSMLDGILAYFVILFTIIVLLDLVAKFPQVGAILLTMIVLAVATYFPHRKIFLKYRALTIDLEFWEKGKIYTNLPYLLGIASTMTLIILLLIIPFK